MTQFRRRFRLRLLFTALQVVIALSLYLYEPYQFHARAERVHAVGFEYFLLHSPAPAQRIARSLSFPAYVVSSPLERFQQPLYERETNHGYYLYKIKDLVFLFGVAVLWFWVGGILQFLLVQDCRRDFWASRSVAEGVCALALAFWIGKEAIRMALAPFPYLPQKQTGQFGLLWFAALLAYSVLVLIQKLYYPKRAAAHQ